MTDIDFHSWVLDHPVKAILLLAACSAAGGLLGVETAVFTSETHHWVSGDNIAAGFGEGTGGVVLGWLAWALIVHILTRRQEREQQR